MKVGCVGFMELLQRQKSHVQQMQSDIKNSGVSVGSFFPVAGTVRGDQNGRIGGAQTAAANTESRESLPSTK